MRMDRRWTLNWVEGEVENWFTDWMKTDDWDGWKLGIRSGLSSGLMDFEDGLRFLSWESEGESSWRVVEWSWIWNWLGFLSEKWLTSLLNDWRCIYRWFGHWDCEFQLWISVMTASMVVRLSWLNECRGKILMTGHCRLYLNWSHVRFCWWSAEHDAGSISNVFSKAIAILDWWSTRCSGQAMVQCGDGWHVDFTLPWLGVQLVCTTVVYRFNMSAVAVILTWI